MALAERALTAFRQDPVYLLDMIQHDGLIRYKKAVWAARKEADVACKEAKSRCSNSAVKECRLESPCGFGLCPFAKPDHRGLTEPSHGSSSRPPASTREGYSTQDAVEHVIQLRGISKPPPLTAGLSRRETA
jgi:hypothetical protein